MSSVSHLGNRTVWKRIGAVVYGTFLAAVMLAASVPHDSVAQDIVEVYRTQRFRVISSRVAARQRPITPRQPNDLPVSLDTLALWQALQNRSTDQGEPSSPPIIVERWTRTPKLLQNWFVRRFGSGSWVYLGANRLEPLDTTRTQELRAGLQGHFGKPTVVLADERGKAELAERNVTQFQYWFALNDSIPLLVMDVNGPFERGLVVATDEVYGALLPAIKKAFLDRLISDPARDAYVDYYIDVDTGQWFMTGYDGRDYVLRPIDRPDLGLSRPVLSTLVPDVEPGVRSETQSSQTSPKR